MMQLQCLAAIMRGAFNEIYIDADTLGFIETNQAARDNLQYSEAELAAMTPVQIASGLDLDALAALLQPLRTGDTAQATLDTIHVRKDGSSYPLQCRLFHCAAPETGGAATFVLIGNDVSTQHASAEALGISESRFHAIVSNTPGLVYQFVWRPDGQTSFPYLGDGCRALLGITSEHLRSVPSQFVELILPIDRPSYLESMAASAAELKSWNWEGRIWIDAWRDVKWINLRSTPRIAKNGGVQWEGIMSNITQSKLEESEIKQSRARLAELSAHVDRVKEQERTRIAREIHDDIGGNLTAIKMALSLLTNRLPANNPVLRDKTAYVELLVDRTIDSAHMIARDLRPSILDFGVVAALDWQTRESEKQLGFPCQFSANVSEIELHPDQATAIFRIFQEAMTNIAKHAQASRVGVNLIRHDAGVTLKIADNGVGIAAADCLKSQSFGIRGMVERAQAMGGELTVGPVAGGGSVVTVELPLSAD
ncbi:histidine kinase [Undibacterium arcticum]|uniref:PAS domain-containing sensor histidine kinase n=1 Tax=Undibacterium arcticum TaxID=1762892 RepID=UPI0036153AEB